MCLIELLSVFPRALTIFSQFFSRSSAEDTTSCFWNQGVFMMKRTLSRALKELNKVEAIKGKEIIKSKTQGWKV